MKLCKDCKYFVPSSEWENPPFKNKYATCSRTDYIGVAELGERCSKRREEVKWFSGDYCGPEGRQWEAA